MFVPLLEISEMWAMTRATFHSREMPWQNNLKTTIGDVADAV